VGVRVVRGPTEREVGGQLALTLPLDRFASPRSVASADAPPDSESEEQVPLPPVQTEPASASTAAAFPLSIAAFLKLARDTVRQALSTSGVDEETERLDGLASRARSSAVLPELRLRAARSDDQALRLAPTNEDPYRYSLAGGTDLVLEATATWNLDRLVFADEEVALSRLRLERDKARAVVVERVLDRLFVWRRSFLKLLDPATPTEEALKAELELVDAVVALDVMTDGAFGERLVELGLARQVASGAEPRGERAAPSRDSGVGPVSDGRTSGFALSTPRDVGRNQEQSPRPPKACSGAKGVSLTSLP
jgi:hypothetical protein